MRPLGPVPAAVPYPDALYLYAVNAIPRNYAGRSSSIISKARIFAEQAGVPSTLVTFLHSSELADIEHGLRERGVIGDTTTFVCLHDYYPDDTSWTGEDVTYPLEEPGFHWIKDPDYEIYRFFDAEGVYRFYKRYDHAGRMIVRDFFNANRCRTLREEFRTNGTLRRRIYMDLHFNLPRQEVHYRADQTPSFTVWWVIDPDTLQRSVERVTVFDGEGRPVEVHDTLDPINHLCLDRLIGDRHAFIMVEDRNIDRYLLTYANRRAKSIYVLHNAHIKEPYDDIRAIRPSYRTLFEARDRVDAIVFLTATQRAEAEARYGRTESFRVLPHSVRPAVEEPGVPRDPNLVVMMARLDKQKQVDHAIEAFARVVKRLPEARLEIYGRGSDLPALRNLVTDLGVGRQVKLMGFTRQPGLAYQRGSLCIMTSRYEGAPLTVQEAMSYGCPVISYDLRYGPADIIEDGVSGLLVPYGNRTAMADRIVATLQDPDLLGRLSAAARIRAADFGEPAFAARWGELFSELDTRGWEPRAGA
ncbi:MAG: glycosyltransferase [Propionicimonas sp.]|uniref:glycosyltransferase n=1 Tax=Propionicimonas sp. TaxID=1955623 RepID=UPI003D0CB960